MGTDAVLRLDVEVVRPDGTSVMAAAVMAIGLPLRIGSAMATGSPISGRMQPREAARGTFSLGLAGGLPRFTIFMERRKRAIPEVDDEDFADARSRRPPWAWC